MTLTSEIKKTKEMNAIIQKLEITHSLIILDKASKEKLKNQQEIFQMLK